MGAVTICIVFVSVSAASEPVRIAFLAAEPTLDEMGPHNRAAWAAAGDWGEATLLLASAEHGFVDTAGDPHGLAGFDVVWYHQGDAIARTPMYRGAPLAAMRAFAKSGGGVLLSGGALAMVAQLGLEPDIRPQRHELGNFRDPAAMAPVEQDHPAFTGLREEDGVVWLSRGGCPAVADFYWGGPGEGMVLANTPAGVQRPLVEYELGAGRVIVFGWHWPDYADRENPHRPNLLRLTANLLTYLARAESWKPVVIRSAFPPAAFSEEPGIAAPRWRALRMAIKDLCQTFPGRYAQGPGFLERLQALHTEHDRLPRDAGADAFAPLVARFEALHREALLANPLCGFDRLLLIRRRADHLGLPLNFNGNTDLEPTGYGNTLVTIAPGAPASETETVFRPTGDRFIGDLDLHYDAEKLLLSIPDKQGRWGVAELHLATGTLDILPLIDEPDVHNYDACYLPDERIVFTSTAPFHGVPCVGGRSKVANLYLRGREGQIRRLTNDQDHNWCPAVLNNGRILYQRWEYTDIAHAFTRLLFHANPDGSQQMEYYGSNSFWPTAMFYAQPIPGHPTEVVAVIGGHHGTPRQGELVILDPARGRHEANGAVQRIPGYGEPVEPVILDSLADASWPRFLHPFPLSEKYFLVSCKPTKTAHWGIYLVDIFDNFVLLHEEPGWAMLEPIPLRETPRQPIIPDVVDPSRTDANVLLMDVYRGPGLDGVPRGSVEALRLVSYSFTYHGLGAEPDRVGLDGPWDVKRILGTVPVADDGSAHFKVPACTPVSVQPLDAEGKALALMRSWFTAAPGETLSCVGCHEKQNMAPPIDAAPQAFRREPSPIEPWYGPARGFSFEREVQPVLDAYCIECHHGGTLPDGRATFDLTAQPAARVPSAFQMHFSPAYMALRRWVHTPTLESDAHLLPPRDFHADTSKLVQILRDGHYGVRLDTEAWQRLITWIDLHAPFHGTWHEVVAANPDKHAAALHGAERRRALHKRYAGIDEDPEAVYPPAKLDAVPPPPMPESPPKPTGQTPHTAPKPAGNRQTVAVTLADGVTMTLVRVEPGTFVMGSDEGYPNERPAHMQTIEQPFFIGRTEVTNRQYACFDPAHDSGLETGEAYQFGDDERGFPLDRPTQPVVRVSWDDARAFCGWLSEKTGDRFALPTEAQWEYACRAGSASPLWYGTLDDDFSSAANLSDATHHTVYYPHVPTAIPPWRPADTRFDDGWRVAARAGAFDPNPWGLFDMHGNVSEWTRSRYAPYPGAADQRGTYTASGRRKVVRGGSWRDRPKRARSAFRLHYHASQAVHDVGFRIVCEAGDAPQRQDNR
ncbi:MAG: SUMF1/EgtB/PvdO family nonheme iron enzyme [Candidatus Hydrogenedentota bacterium]